VDAKGCPSDADGDGVCDGVDVCPNTPRGSRVDAHGCPSERSPLESELLDTGKIRIENFQFDRKKGVIQPQSLAAVEEAGRVLQQYPQLRVEVGGHTDNRGSKAQNDEISEARARAVLDHLKATFPSVPVDQYTVKGYGFSKPVAPNTTDAGRTRNRRVEFRVLNPGALRTERDKRRSVRGGVPAPAPAPAPADTTRR
jgi:outer membrane protein OmpA-like peptidoglycan-associated protein